MTSYRQTQFDNFMSQLRDTNTRLADLVDFPKVIRNVSAIEMDLYALDFLLGKSNLAHAVASLFQHNPGCFRALGLLVAVRNSRRPVLESTGAIAPMDSYFRSSERVMEFLLETGLAEVFKRHDIKNLVDYALGIEVGLDSNARKNRGGHTMEHIVSSLLRTRRIPFRAEVYSQEFIPIAHKLGTDAKRFDFVIQTVSCCYLIETNFYNGGGSKLNEVARAYSQLAPKINSIPGFRFVWITDGIGWRSARNKLEEAFEIIPDIYNLTTLPDFLDNLPLHDK